MKRLVLACVVVLGACETTTSPTQIDKALQDLAVDCVGGDKSACDTYADLYDQRQSQQVAAPVAVAPVYQPIQLQPFPQMTGPQRTVCQPQYGQQIVCRTY